MTNFLRSMGGRVFLILLTGILAAAALTWWLAFGERQRAITQFRDARAAEIVEKFIQSIDSMPASDRPAYAAQARRFGIRFELGQSAASTAASMSASASEAVSPTGPLARILNERIGRDFAIIPLRIAPDECPQPRMRMQPEKSVVPYALPPRGQCEALAVTLHDGAQVRVVALQARNPAPPLPPDLPLYIGLFLLSVAALVFVVTRMTMRPLRQLADAARAFGDDLNHPPLEQSGSTEIRQASAAFNAMQARIKEHIRQRTHMLAAITHDLQTPLTRLRLRLEKVADPALRDKLIEDLAATQSMVKEGLELARSMDASEPAQALDLDSLVHAVCDDAADAGLDVVMEGRSGKFVMARPTALRRCMTNLVDNAVKYGDFARVRVALDGERHVRITVGDGGRGIPEDQLEKVFEPFYRVEDSRSRETGGTGLGLTIARNIVEQHGGKIGIRNLPDGGAEVAVTLPTRG